MSIAKVRKISKIMRIMVPVFAKSLFCPVPIWVSIYVTRKCNLNCKYCFVKDSKRKDLPTKDVISVIDKLHELGCRTVDFFGGEPTLRKDLVELVRHASKKNMVTVLSTNGVLLNKELLNSLGEAGLDAILMSLDSVFDNDLSVKTIGRKRQLLDALIATRKKFGIQLLVGNVLTPDNVDAVPNTITELSKLKIPISVGLCTENTYNDKSIAPGSLFEKEEDKKKLFRVLKVMKRMKKDRYLLLDPIAYLDEMEKYVQNKNPEWDCPAGKYHFSVDCDGRFIFCPGLQPESVSIFNITKNFFTELERERERESI